MFDIAPDHAIGIYAALLALPMALTALKLRRPMPVPGTVLGASVLMAMSGAIHLGLAATHTDESITAALFVANGLAFLTLSQLYTWRWWRLLSTGLITATLLGYLTYIVLGFDTPDQVAVATKLLELLTLGLVLVPVRGEVGKPHRSSRRPMAWRRRTRSPPHRGFTTRRRQQLRRTAIGTRPGRRATVRVARSRCHPPTG
jgi:hypothetical protein